VVLQPKQRPAVLHDRTLWPEDGWHSRRRPLSVQRLQPLQQQSVRLLAPGQVHRRRQARLRAAAKLQSSGQRHGIKETWPNYIKYQAIQSYLAGADCVGFWSNEHFESNTPLYLSEGGQDRWQATVEVSQDLTDLDVYTPDNKIALVWGSYQVGPNQNPDGINSLKNTLVIGNLLTQWGVQYDIIQSKQIEASPSILNKYGGIVIAGLNYEPQAVVTAVQNAPGTRLYDTKTFQVGPDAQAVTFVPGDADVLISGHLAAVASEPASASMQVGDSVASFLSLAGLAPEEFLIQMDPWVSQARTAEGTWYLDAQIGYTFMPSPGGSICAEEWSCTSWSDCTDGIMTRHCYETTNCNTEYDKPDEAR